jgi:hypothetical protein
MVHAFTGAHFHPERNGGIAGYGPGRERGANQP